MLTRSLARRFLVVALVLCLAVMAVACGVLPPSLSLGTRLATPTVIPLGRCNADPTLICVITFGLAPPDQMLVAVLLPFGGFSDIVMTVEHDGQQLAYPCSALPGFPDRFTCTGPQVPLGAAVRLSVRTGSDKTLLARGDFVVAGLALPTLALGGTPLPAETSTPVATSTRAAAGYPNP